MGCKYCANNQTPLEVLNQFAASKRILPKKINTDIDYVPRDNDLLLDELVMGFNELIDYLDAQHKGAKI